MKLCAFACRAAARLFHSTPGRACTLLPVQTAKWEADDEADNIQSFKQGAFAQQVPLFFSRHQASPTLAIPAFKKWFSPSSSPSSRAAAIRTGLSQHLDQFQHVPFLYEIVTTPEEKLEALNAFCASLVASQELDNQVIAGILHSTLAGSPSSQFFQLHAPLKLLYKALEFTSSETRLQRNNLDIYIAQSLLSHLPSQLQHDLPTPRLVLKAGKGDLYSSSIWLGTEPTYTPLHRDPNPNIFCQLYNHKVVRLLPPQQGQQLYSKVKMQLQQQGSSRIRGADMMEGKERVLLHEAIWQPEMPMYEVKLEAGDALFIPQGWWHSVKSKESSGDLNASVNWWFR